MEISPWNLPIFYEVIPLHIYNRYRSNDFSEEHLWGTAAAITIWLKTEIKI